MGNDEIKLRLWRSNMNKNNTASNPSKTQSISGWHLDIPNWAAAEAGSEKVRKRNEMKLMRELQSEEERREIKKRRKDEEVLRREQMVLNYADQGNEHYHYNGGFMREKRETEDT